MNEISFLVPQHLYVWLCVSAPATSATRNFCNVISACWCHGWQCHTFIRNEQQLSKKLKKNCSLYGSFYCLKAHRYTHRISCMRDKTKSIYSNPQRSNVFEVISNDSRSVGWGSSFMASWLYSNNIAIYLAIENWARTEIKTTFARAFNNKATILTKFENKFGANRVAPSSISLRSALRSHQLKILNF